MEKGERSRIFISHATPGDNAFATWLASRLSMAGYEVWCDQEKLLGGEDFWQVIEDEIRERTIKFVLVISQNAFDSKGKVRDGIQKEVALAGVLKKKLEDENFIIPLRIDDTSFSDFSIDFLRLNGVDASKNWAEGLDSLIKVLRRDNVLCSDSIYKQSLDSWRFVHQFQKQAMESDNEKLQSNWLSILSLPEDLYFYKFLNPVKSTAPRAIASDCNLPCSDHGRLLLSFAREGDLQRSLGPEIPIKLRGMLKTEDFLKGKTGDILGIKPHDAKNKLTSIIRQGWDILMRGKGLNEYHMSHYTAWWFSDDTVSEPKIKYLDLHGKTRHRQVIGTKGKVANPDGSYSVKYHWHLGMTARPLLGEHSVLMLQPRVIISDTKKEPLINKTKLNSVRRSTTNMWFNDKWRSLMLAFCSWLSDGKETFEIPLGEGVFAKISGQPELFTVPVAIKADPVTFYDDTVAEENERNEELMRLSDPAFLKMEDGEVEDE